MIVLEVMYHHYFDLVKYCCFAAVRSFGIIGGGAVLFTAPFVVGQAILPVVGGGKKQNLFCKKITLFHKLFQALERQQEEAL